MTKGRPHHALLAACLAFGALEARAAEVSLRAPRLKAPPVANESYRSGLRFDLRGDHRAAAEAYRAPVNASHPRAAFHRKMSEQIAAMREAVRRSPDAYDENFNLGVNLQNKYWALYLDLGVRSDLHYRLAEHHFKEAMRLQPTVANPLICLAALYAQAGDRGRARDLMAGLGGRETRPSDLYNLAFYHKVMGDLDESFRILRQAFQFDIRHREWVRESDDFTEYLDDPRMKALLEDPSLGQLTTPLRMQRLRTSLPSGKIRQYVRQLRRIRPLVKPRLTLPAPHPAP
jgi:tetratricopeptide (TPR) repeat protein